MVPLPGNSEVVKIRKSGEEGDSVAITWARIEDRLKSMMVLLKNIAAIHAQRHGTPPIQVHNSETEDKLHSSIKDAIKEDSTGDLTKEENTRKPPKRRVPSEGPVRKNFLTLQQFSYQLIEDAVKEETTGGVQHQPKIFKYGTPILYRDYRGVFDASLHPGDVEDDKEPWRFADLYPVAIKRTEWRPPWIFHPFGLRTSRFSRQVALIRTQYWRWATLNQIRPI